LVVLLALVAATAAYELGHSKESFIYKKFEKFMSDNDKTYSTIEEYTTRFNIFKTNYLRTEKKIRFKCSQSRSN